MVTVIFIVFLIVLQSVPGLVLGIKRDENVVAGAINGILKGYFQPRESKVDLFYYGIRGGLSENIVEAILQSKPSGVSVKIIQVTPENNQPIQTNLSSIHIFESYEVFNQMSQLMKRNFHRHYEQLYYIPDYYSNDLKSMSFDNKLFINNNFLVYQEPNSNLLELISLFQSKPPPDCDISQVTTINRYIEETKCWENSNFFPKHFQDFNHCLIPFDSDQYYSRSTMPLCIIDTLATHLHFRLYPVDKKSGTRIDMDLNYYEYNSYTQTHFASSVAVQSDEVIFLIPPGEPYTQLEKMFLMFGNEVWMAIGATFVITLSIIQVINCMSIKVRKFVYGQNIRSPTLNFIDIFLNGGQHQEPKTNFARFILMLFVVWSLVIRTCYQSTLYALLQTDLRKPRPETIDQLIENNFTLCSEPGIAKVFIDPELIQRFKSQNLAVNNTATILSDPRNKYAFLSSKIALTNLLKRKDFRGVEIQYFALTERIRSLHFSVLMPKNSPYYERINELIDRMVQHGLIVFCNNVLHGEGPPRKPDEPEAQVLSLKHIGIGFIIILVLLSFSLVVFVMELISHKLNTSWKTKRQRNNHGLQSFE